MITPCSQCGSTHYSRERRPNGYTKCLDCGYKTLSSTWDDPVKDEYVATQEGPVRIELLPTHLLEQRVDNLLKQMGASNLLKNMIKQVFKRAYAVD